jgi:hypothetical protein
MSTVLTTLIVGSLLLGGQDRPFALGEAQQAAVQGLHHRKGDDGQPLTAAAYQRTFGPEALRQGPLAGVEARDFVYAALVAGYASQGLRVDFTFLQVEQWLAATPAAAQQLWDAVAQSLPPVKPAPTRPAKKAAK